MRDRVIGRLFFWFVFFGRAKKMNENNELNNFDMKYMKIRKGGTE